MRTSTLLLTTGDYSERLSALYQAVMQAREDEKQAANEPKRVGDDGASASEVLRQEYETLREEAEREGISVTLRAIPRPAFRELKAKFPPRSEGDEDALKKDRVAGLNVDAVEDDLVFASLLKVRNQDVETVYRDEPSDDKPKVSRAVFEEWINTLSEGDWGTITGRAWELTNVSWIDPKSLPGWPTRSGGSSGA